MEAFIVALASVWADSGFSALTVGHVIMITVGLILLYMAIGKGFEPLLLSPIAFGCILANIPKNGFDALSWFHFYRNLKGDSEISGHLLRKS